MLQPSKLLNSTRELLILLSIFTLLILTSILNLYGEYGEFIEKEFYFTNGKILNIYVEMDIEFLNSIAKIRLKSLQQPHIERIKFRYWICIRLKG